MKRIVLSLAVIAIATTVVVGATRAYFSDTETSTGNTISAGTIDISVNEQEVWQENFSALLEDMKPGMTREITFTVHNSGTNPVVLRKQLTNFIFGSSLDSSECVVHGGRWAGSTCVSDGSQYLSNVMTYSMEVGTTVLIDEDWGVTMSNVSGLWVPLGSLDPDESVVVTQSYHFDEATGNWAQGDTLAFDINLYAEQVGGPGPSTTTGVVLENKDTSTWDILVDGTWGILTWDDSGDYTLKAFGLNDALTYRLASFVEPSGPETGISTYQTPSSGVLTISGNYAGFGASDMKYWLRPSDWSNANTLWEGNIANQ